MNNEDFVNDKKAEDSLAKVVRNDNYDINYEIYKLENEINASKKALTKNIDDDIKEIISQNLKQNIAKLHVLKTRKETMESEITNSPNKNIFPK